MFWTTLHLSPLTFTTYFGRAEDILNDDFNSVLVVIFGVVNLPPDIYKAVLKINQNVLMTTSRTLSCAIGDEHGHDSSVIVARPFRH